MKQHRTYTRRSRCSLAASVLILSSGLGFADSDDQAGAYASGNSGNFMNSLVNRPEVGGPLQGFYCGFGLGGISTDYADSVNDGSVSMIGGNDEGFGYSVYLGYSFSDNIAVEMNYSASNDVDYSAMSDGSGISWAAGPVSAEYDAEFFTLTTVGRYPLAPRWWLLGKLGVSWWETTETFNESGFISSQTDSGSAVFVGLGLEYDIGEEDRAIYRFELGYVPVGGDDDLDIISASVGMRYEFP